METIGRSESSVIALVCTSLSVCSLAPDTLQAARQLFCADCLTVKDGRLQDPSLLGLRLPRDRPTVQSSKL